MSTGEHMDILFRLSQNIEGFNDIEETKEFFKEVLPNRDDNYFYNVNRASFIPTRQYHKRLKEREIK